MDHMISFIVPTYNEESFIPHALNSIRQAMGNRSQYEIVVVDNGSTDKTVPIAESLKAKVFTNSSLTVAGLRNLGAKMAQGNILIFLDADINLTTNWGKHFHTAQKILRKNSYTLIGSRCGISTDATWIEKAWFEPLLNKKMKHMNSGHLIISKELFDHLGGFREELVADEDPDLSRRARNIGAKILNLPKLEVIHLRYPKTLKNFFAREIWHGKGQYQQGMFGSTIGILTVLFLLLHILFFISFFWPTFKGSMIIASFIFIICFTSSSIKYKRSLRLVLTNTYLYYFYFLARGISFLMCLLIPGYIDKKRTINT